MGKMIDAQSIVVSSTATRQVGREAAIFQFVFKHSIALACLVGAIVMLYAFAFPWIIPAATPRQVIGSNESVSTHPPPMISLPARVPRAHQVWMLTESLTNFTEPSPKAMLTPPGWLLVAVIAAPIPPQVAVRDVRGRIRSAGARDAVGRHDVRVGVVRGREVGAQEPLGSEAAVERRLRRPRQALAGGDERLGVARAPLVEDDAERHRKQPALAGGRTRRHADGRGRLEIAVGQQVLAEEGRHRHPVGDRLDPDRAARRRWRTAGLGDPLKTRLFFALLGTIVPLQALIMAGPP